MEIASPLPPLPPAQRRNKRSSSEPYSPSCAMETIEPSPASKRRRMFGDASSSENSQISQPLFSPLQPRTKKRFRLDEQSSSLTSSPPPSSEDVKRLENDLNEQKVESARLMSENKVLKKAVFAQHTQLSNLQSSLTLATRKIDSMKTEGQSLLNKVHQLSTENYALKAHMGQVEGNGGGFGGSNRDIF
ncbi:hypothetical protein TrVE_jg3369 [Triparma verrucosa]|uniref:Uncharacterized protein n=1 Tax=Triparma verrucosa TaxID=1606542 RepID=A0A9W7KXS3_9STRA|nr:hypothetical protein TrVE_jg3369 [Triparma verrucosa]